MCPVSGVNKRIIRPYPRLTLRPVSHLCDTLVYHKIKARQIQAYKTRSHSLQTELFHLVVWPRMMERTCKYLKSVWIGRATPEGKVSQGNSETLVTHETSSSLRNR